MTTHITKTGNPEPPISPKRILVVEDELPAALSMRLLLTSEGHTVDLTESAEQAVCMFELHGYDLVIADFKLPNMDGLELAEAIKQRVPSCPFMLVTAFAETVQDRPGEVSNVDVLLGKPISVESLRQAVHNLFGSAVSTIA